MLSIWERYWTPADIDAAISTHVASLASNAAVDLETLLVQSESATSSPPVNTLAERLRQWIAIGELLTLGVEPQTWPRLTQVAHRIHDIERQLGRSAVHSSLFRGVAHIASFETAIGVRCIVRAQEADTVPLPAPHQCLAFGALATAAMQKRNPDLALRYSEARSSAARNANLTSEHFRSELAIGVLYAFMAHPDAGQLLQRLRSRASNPGHGLERLPASWNAVCDDVGAWLSADGDGEKNAPSRLHAPADDRAWPLLPGLVWSSERGLHATLDEGHDVAEIAALLRRLSATETRDTLSIDSLIEASQALARWDLQRPLFEVERILAHKAPSRFFQSLLTRLLGRGVSDAVRTLPPQSANKVLEERSDVVIWMADVKRYASLSEHREPELLFRLLGPIFKIITESLEQAGGMVHEFVGDAILVVFNAFGDHPARPLDILNQTATCLRKIHHMAALFLGYHLPPLDIGVGIHQGRVGIGYLGGLSRCHLATLGNATNISARLESATRHLPCPVAISDAFFGGSEPDPWTVPDLIRFSLRDLGQHSLKHIEVPVQLYGLDTLVHYWVDFVPMGFVAAPDKGLVYLDTGNHEGPGIFDPHDGGTAAGSACELVLEQAEALRQHLTGIPDADIEFRLHEQPDLDCVASLYVAQELLRGSPRLPLLHCLATYVSQIDQGITPAPETLADSLYAVLLVHQFQRVAAAADENRDYVALEAGLRVLDAAMFLTEMEGGEPQFEVVFRNRPSWFREDRALIREDRQRYLEDHRTGLEYQAHVVGVESPVTGLWLDHPTSHLFKIWARTDGRAPGKSGYAFLAVDLSSSDRNRVVISVDPSSGTSLVGLGQHLEAAEAQRRKELGEERPAEPRRHPTDNADPWYFGQGHRFTIVDAPARGTIFSPEAVRLIHSQWRPGSS